MAQMLVRIDSDMDRDLKSLKQSGALSDGGISLGMSDKMAALRVLRKIYDQWEAVECSSKN